MSNGESDAYQTYGDYRKVLGHLGLSRANNHPFRPSEAFSEADHDMIALARNEGFEIYADLDPGYCDYVGSSLYGYNPKRPRAWVSANLTWPQYRWYMAVALGHHFTRHHFFERSTRAVWCCSLSSETAFS